MWTTTSRRTCSHSDYWNPAPLRSESPSQSPALFLEIVHCLGEFIQSLFFANNLENNIVYSDCCLHGITQALEVDHSGTDRVVTPYVRACVRDMDQRNVFAVGEQALDGLLF